MLKTGTEVMMVYRARIECYGTWDLFLSLSGIRKSPSSGNLSHVVDYSTKDNKTDQLAERHQPLDLSPLLKDENLVYKHGGLQSLEHDDAFDEVSL